MANQPGPNAESVGAMDEAIGEDGGMVGGGRWVDGGEGSGADAESRHVVHLRADKTPL